VKTYGWANVLNPLIKELKLLESEGIDLVINGTKDNYKVILSCVTGDNLFLNGLLGFVESFTAGHPCRHCTEHRHNFGKKFFEDANVVRTVQNYDEDLLRGETQATGIKAQCALNQLKYFHAADNYVQDIMHDLLEGVCSYDMRLICKNLTEKITLEELNRRIQCVNFGYHDLSSKPPFTKHWIMKCWLLKQLKCGALSAICQLL
jgi:hypothetical protein